MTMIIRIEKLQPNGRYRVETVGVGMARTYQYATEAWLHAERLAATWRRTGREVRVLECGF